MKRPSFYFRFYTLGAIFIAALAILIVRLWYVQIARGAEYTAKIRGRSQVTVRIPAVRGEILDRNGIPLVENRASFEVDFYLPAMVKAYREKYGKLPMTSYRATVRGMLKDIPVADIDEIVDKAIIPRLSQLRLNADYNPRRLQTHYERNQEVPYTFMENIDFNTMVRFLENNLGLPGVSVEIKPVRDYIYGSFAAHLLGYVGPPTEIDREEASKFNFYQPDIEGKAQIEQSMNKYLKGKPGVRILERDAKGVIKGEIKRVEPTPGDNVYLTIDARIQFIAEQALRAVGRGAAVVLDPNNGEILAMASVPSYDPNTFIPSISSKDWVALNKDLATPMVNRAISAYAPGSTYKIMVSLAGLRAGVGDKKFTCSGGVQYGDHYMKCWNIHGHGSLKLEDAIKVSCNAFFYQYGNAAGIDEMDVIGNLLGLGQKTGVPLSGEVPGILPGPAWLAKERPMERWSNGFTANTAIGQGFVLATPLQMANVAAAVANGGTVYYPRLIEKVVASDGNVVMEEPAKVRDNLVADAGLTPEQIERVRKGMWKVVNEGGGTAGRARVKKVEVAGKTGTAQFTLGNMKDNRVWFIGFAPFENPQFAICVMVEGAESGGRVAAPIASKILGEALALNDSKEPFVLKRLEPTKGTFGHISLVDYGQPIPAAITEDGETAPSVGTNETSNSQAAAAATEPTIRPDGEERGRTRARSSRSNRADRGEQSDRTGIQKFFDIFRKKKSSQ